MIIDGLKLLEGSQIQNAAIAYGPSFPTSPDIGELFYKDTTDVDGIIGMYVYDGTAWVKLSDDNQLNAIISGTATAINYDVDFPTELTLNRPIVDGELFYKTVTDVNGDAGLYYYDDPNTTWVSVASPTVDAGNVVGVLSTSNIPNLDWSKITTGTPTTLSGYGISDASGILTQLLTVDGAGSTLDADLLDGHDSNYFAIASDVSTLTSDFSTHESDTALHLTAGQDAFLDGITVTSADINYLSGISSNVQDQLDSKQPLDGDLTAIAALTGTSGYLKTNGSGVWSVDTNSFLTGHPVIAAEVDTSNTGLTFIQNLDFDEFGHVVGQTSAPISSASTSQEGVVQLSDSISTTSSVLAATSTAVKSAYDLAADALPKTGGTMTGNLVISAGSHITIADAPSSGTDAINKNYLDAHLAGLSWKQAVKVATTANITLSGTQTIDGVSVIAGDRVLVKNQSTASENGIYVVDASNWVRATDMDATTPINELNSAAVFVERGLTNADSGWTQINNIQTLGTDTVSFTQFNGAASISPGIGLSITGNQIDINLGAGIAQLPSDEVGIDLYVGGGLMMTVDGTTTDSSTSAQLSLAKVGTAGTYRSVTTDDFGRVTAGTNPTTVAGYGLTDVYTKTEVDNLNWTLADITDAGTIASQNANSVTISGGTINGTSIGATTASSGKFTTLNISSDFKLSGSSGTVGQVLVSGGSGVAPTWQDFNSSEVAYTNGLSTSGTLTTTTTAADQTVYSLPIATFRSAEFLVQVVSGFTYHMTKIQVIHDGVNVWVSEYGTVFTSASLATFSASISGGNLLLTTTPTNASTTYKFIVNAIKI